MQKYSFMNKDVRIFDFYIDENLPVLNSVVFTGNLLYAPYNLSSISDQKEMIKQFNNWLENRYQVNSSWYIRNKKINGNIPIFSKTVLTSYGFSLSDQYWIKPYDFDIKWEEKNFFTNSFHQNDFISLTSQERQYDYSDTTTLYSPDVTTGGELSKAWAIDKDNKRVLYKGSSTFKATEPINELMATKICEILEISAVNYTISVIDDLDKKLIASKCETFINQDTELIPASALMDYDNSLSTKELIDNYINFLENNGVIDADSKVKKMFILDCIMSNHDRHLNNFGIIRDVNTLKFLDVAPIFDTGRSLLTYRPEYDLNYDNELLVFRKQNISHKEVLEACTDINITKNQVDKLKKVPLVYKYLLLKYQEYTNIQKEEEIYLLVEKLEKNINQVIEILFNK